MSTRLSPLTVEVEEPPKLRLSAERRFSASSKELRVRVEGSLNMLTMVLPLSVGTFLIARSLTSENALAVSRMSLMSSSEYSVMSIRCLWLNATVLLTSQRRGAHVGTRRDVVNLDGGVAVDFLHI